LTQSEPQVAHIKIYTSDNYGLTANSIPTDTSNEVYVQITVKEPLFLSPFLVGADCEGHHPGIYGMNNMNLTLNFLNNANRAWRCARYPIYTPGTAVGATPVFFGNEATLARVVEAKIECKFYTPKREYVAEPTVRSKLPRDRYLQDKQLTHDSGSNCRRSITRTHQQREGSSPYLEPCAAYIMKYSTVINPR